jgi:hypothetical protein
VAALFGLLPLYSDLPPARHYCENSATQDENVQLNGAAADHCALAVKNTLEREARSEGGRGGAEADAKIMAG